MGNTEGKSGKLGSQHIYSSLSALSKGELEESDLDAMWRDCVGTRAHVGRKELEDFIQCIFLELRKSATFDVAQMLAYLDPMDKGEFSYSQFRSLFSSLAKKQKLPLSQDFSNLLEAVESQFVADTQVNLNIYDMCGGLNNAMKKAGLGAYHTAVEVYGIEISFGTPDGMPKEREALILEGIYTIEPKASIVGIYKETISLGLAPASQADVLKIIEDLSSVWIGKDYDIIEHNCHHFCDDLALRLVRHHIPKHLMAIDKFAKPFKPFLTPSQSRSNSQSLSSLTPQEAAERLKIQDELIKTEKEKDKQKITTTEKIEEL